MAYLDADYPRRNHTMRLTVLMVAVVMGVLYCSCDILAPPKPDYRETNRQNRQIERLMKQIEELGKPSKHDAPELPGTLFYPRFTL
jgi:cytochrome c556